MIDSDEQPVDGPIYPSELMPVGFLEKLAELELTCRRRAEDGYMVAPGWEWFADALRHILQGAK